ncbi:uncharacterized protein LOC129903602 [Solanum dulcamara]|uniref:uncharacterized protein LOC129903602 n=1 Tax=Solanum dulcamara TaxID=45834 RepID=UPI002485218A|nr:uncharacterized protein LOC129903602 [Solanum dulcamara]
MVEDIVEVFMDNFSVVDDTFNDCLLNLSKALQRCVEGLEVDKAKIEKLPPPISIKGVCSFLGHTGFYSLFTKDFSKFAHPLCKLLQKEIKFYFNEACIKVFDCLKEKLISTPMIVAPDWFASFEIICDASSVALGVVLG